MSSRPGDEWRLDGPRAERIRTLLGEDVVLLEHVGSTSVPGLPAKPIIDILLIVPERLILAEDLA